jgi:TPR repeat protein
LRCAITRDATLAAQWLQKATESGHGNAPYLLGEIYWNDDGVEKSHEQAAKYWEIAAKRRNRSAPALLAKYYFTISLVPAEKRVAEEPGIKTAYWGTVATIVDPDPMARADSQKLVDMILGFAPQLKPKVQELLEKDPVAVP